MSQPLTLNPRIVEALYCEALVLSDEVRHAFTLSGRLDRIGMDEDPARVALSSEGLRTTTQLMHGIAWLLNHRAFFMGEINREHLQRHGRLAPELRHADPRQVAHLTAEIAELIARTHHFYERLLRLDTAWRLTGSAPMTAIERLRERIEQRLVG